ncbi:hypothetical protein PHMEG_00010385 [Phytophthora megakarya]|uniref:ZSWIM1/3 RNaseH-like domain-containing protein n=1 Tax=Phytophthora megakarya TaxID=4795 RepID=A0A225WGA6_9STRA|nr:hypothetical protein PHMEG_00010385 [Phytophthora megakarya]
MARGERIRHLIRTKKGKNESELVPECFGPYQRTYICTHGWKQRKSRENACMEARFDGMLSVGAKRSRIYDYLLEHNQNVILSDVDNIVRGHSSSVSAADDSEATAAEVVAFLASDPGSAAGIAENESGETGVISISTAHMCSMYKRFYEVLLVVCSHKTNGYNYQLCTFMVMNEFGEGAVVQHSLLGSTGDWHMDRAIYHFKQAHPDRSKMLRGIVVDKDLNEIRILQNHFPEAQILVCHFHVIKYLKEMRGKPEFGKISSDDASQVDASIHSLVYARAKLTHLKTHTNNRLESYFGKLKDVAESNTNMSMCVKPLVAYDRRLQNHYRYRTSRIGSSINSSYDEEMPNILRITINFVAGQIEQQYARGLENAYTFSKSEDNERCVMVTSRSQVHLLNLEDWKCDCDFALSMLLPCRHAIAYRKTAGFAGPITKSRCARRSSII